MNALPSKASRKSLSLLYLNFSATISKLLLIETAFPKFA